MALFIFHSWTQTFKFNTLTNISNINLLVTLNAYLENVKRTQTTRNFVLAIM
jgi:hypothetical protein